MKYKLIEKGKEYYYLSPLMDDILELRYSDLEEELRLCRQLLEQSEKEGYIYGKAFAITYIGDYYIAKNMGQEAKNYLEQAQRMCKENDFSQLLVEVYIFLGLCYDSLHDLAMSINCTLDALELAIKWDDNWRKSTIINNIANFFEGFGDMEAARHYYSQALSCMLLSGKSSEKVIHYAVLISNLIYLCCYFGEIKEAEELLKELDCVDEDDLSQNHGQLYIAQCHIAAAKKDFDTYYTVADKIVHLTKSKGVWGYEFYDILVHIAKYSIDFDNQKHAHGVLMTLSEVAGENEIGNKIRVQKLWVQYYEKFGTEKQQGWAYKRYYKLKEIVDITNNEAMVAGLHAKIDLKELTKQQEQILKEHAELENEAQRDELTQLYNRRYFTKTVKPLFDDSNIKSIGFAIIDVDYFKQYNDTYGHSKGDDTLRAVAKTMNIATKNNPNIYNIRYGGDEFLVVYLNCSQNDMEDILSNITKQIKMKKIPHTSSKCSNIVTLSIGYYVEQTSQNLKISAKSLIEKADKALYKAKKQGRNQFCSYSEDEAKNEAKKP